ncbi:unnamed protein product [Acanthoscelides obtectus]|uniref:Uncharacterized protein n=1 Tax=Acanthoscelides obtectus TaxID=200917 RepID=A0A9P0KS55_ACAOB|nr:unnamed protein product [Acanthoscelides obtectus]CAK1631863.1 hypothetical protein AOBTE_LOCUS7213 [Acanthoscelides obtectus]
MILTFLSYVLVGVSAHISAFWRLNSEQEGYDAVFCCFMKCLDTHLQILSIATKHIRERLLSKGNMTIDYVVVHDDSFSNFEQEMYEEMKKCNRHLSFLLRIIRDIDEIFSFIMLLQCITSMFMMASNFFVASMLSPFDPEFYSLTEYMFAALAQLCMICHFGGRITETFLLQPLPLRM